MSARLYKTELIPVRPNSRGQGGRAPLRDPRGRPPSGVQGAEPLAGVYTLYNTDGHADDDIVQGATL
ncbi:hypothetical protein RirG_009710 [Rhizophagus irregularis DAOM 197198w]|uniref:Uncharacterized protein n=1 Tax=Rhizophagus irregularis (strain DAOM 197198w) TaxID=1432141 RepID=A0A015KB39_RHIIW|nr:hypothetical protein RirG_009710 [Rhizophagus irregularis DAOM 197198w]